MKKLLKCRVTIFCIVLWILLSVVGYLRKDDIYKNYTVNPAKEPYFVLVLDGIRDGIYPWSGQKPDFWEEWNPMPEKPVSVPAGEDTEQPAEQETEEIQTDTEQESETGSTEDTGLTAEPKEFVEVDESYFDDAVFIGDSRTVGLHDYGGLKKADFFATVGMNVYDMWTEAFCEVDGKKVTLEEALRAKQYGKVYFQIGINEMGRGDLDGFMQAYSQSVEKFKELQPNAVIYVQAIMKVTKAKSDSDAIFNNEGIEARNERIRQLADNVRVFYIDVNEVVCDESGGLKPELTFDNLHLYGSKYDIWVDFLKTKGVKITPVK